MKTEFLALIFGVGGALLILTGCESARLRPSEGTIHRELTPVVKKRQASEAEILTAAANQPLAPVETDGWRTLFDGKSLTGWAVTKFDEGGKVELKDGLLVLQMGEPFVGVNYTNATPKFNYEVTLETMRVAGSDFFCGFTFPVRDSFCSLIVGGWGGSLVGLSNVDSMDASENETTQFITFENGRWYRIRLRVSERKIEAWIEQKKVVNLITTGRKIDLRFGEIESSKPFGFASWSTSAAFRNVKIRDITGPADTKE